MLHFPVQQLTDEALRDISPQSACIAMPTCLPRKEAPPMASLPQSLHLGVPCNGQSIMQRAAAAQMEMHDSENALLDAFVEAVRALDPDILVGFEVQQGSLGFLADRATALERPDPLLRQLSRTPQVTCCHMLCS